MRLRFILAAFFASYAVVIFTAHAAAAPDPIDKADREQAAQFFRAGQDAFLRGDYAVAGHSFEQAHQLLPSGPTIYNAARAWDRLADGPRALAAYEEALTQADLSEAQRGHADKRVKELHAQGVTSPSKPAAAAEPTPPILPAPMAPAPSLPPPPPASPKHRSDSVGWTGVTVAGASAVAAGISGWMFLSKRNEFIDGGKNGASLRSDAVLWGQLTTAAFAVTAVGAGLALWGFHKVKSEPGINVSVGFSGNGLFLGGAY
ncbi:MAG: hypothetical protein SF187_30220 [Deltaproteobacteria bacterium]|nr:hypothetical protein [Deltaproteobacteria bacterium]